MPESLLRTTDVNALLASDPGLCPYYFHTYLSEGVPGDSEPPSAANTKVLNEGYDSILEAVGNRGCLKSRILSLKGIDLMEVV